LKGTSCIPAPCAGTAGAPGVGATGASAREVEQVEALVSSCHWICQTQWIGLRENLQETMVFTIKYRAFL
jgi:hypothetical protein